MGIEAVIFLALCAAGLAVMFGDNDQGMVSSKDLRVIKKPKPYPVVDAHVHIEARAQAYELAVRTMDAAGVAAVINLSGGHGKTLAKSLELARKHRGRFITFCGGWPDDFDFKSKSIGKDLAKMLRESHRMGAQGFGEVVKWALMNKIDWDDARLEPMWATLEELGMPINWHVADPTRYWFKENALRMLEAKGYRVGHPMKQTLIMQQERVLEKYPRLVVIASHANWLCDQIPHLVYRLKTYPNYHFDLSAACDEFGMNRLDFVDVCREFSDRIFFGTDAGWHRRSLQKYGTAKKALAEYKAFFTAHYLFLGTDQEKIPCAWAGAPGQHFVGYKNGFVRYANDGVNLSDNVLRDIYYRNVERMFGVKAGKDGLRNK